jgi:hypothetical protein
MEIAALAFTPTVKVQNRGLCRAERIFDAVACLTVKSKGSGPTPGHGLLKDKTEPPHLELFEDRAEQCRQRRDL